MPQKLKILIAAAEAAPLAKVGGLGDVIGALPKALAKLNLDVRIIIPFYEAIDRKKYKIGFLKSIIINSDSRTYQQVDLWQTKLPGSAIPVYLIEHDYFKGENIYSSKLNNKIHKLYPCNPDDISKFIFFSLAVIESIKCLDFKPDIIHLNDWHTAPIALYLKSVYQSDNFFNNIKTLLTIHNLANQGITNSGRVNSNNFNSNFPSIKSDLEDGNINFMAQGIINADLINTVSPTYAKEILTKKFGCGLDKMLSKRKNNLFGILNGLDHNFFNPTKDKYLRQRYSLKTLKGKSINKVALQKKLGLPVDKNIAVISLISRLVWQKGVDLVNSELIEAINKPDGSCQFVILGMGEEIYEKKLKLLNKKYTHLVKIQIKFDELLAHLIYAASDIFLMPSRFEPCGLGQMIAMQYGTIPLVYPTGGLIDTVNPLEQNKTSSGHKNEEDGFIFQEFSTKGLSRVLRLALDIYYHDKKKWRSLQINGMKKDFSWENSAKEYLRLYKKIV